MGGEVAGSYGVLGRYNRRLVVTAQGGGLDENQ